MKAILIDDEYLILESLERKLETLSNIKIIGKYTNPHTGLIEVSKEQPDVVFLDISMPEVSGLVIARELKRALPDLKIVFLSAYAKHALEAFEINAVDFLLKPLDDERLKRTIKRLENDRTKTPPSQPMISCFEQLSFGYYGKEVVTIDVRWRISKARDVFAYLIHERGKLVRKDVLVELFWPNLPMKEAFAQLYSAIYQIRKTIKNIEFNIQIVSYENSYKVELNNCLVDVDLWERMLKENPLITDRTIEKHKEILNLYKGDYFEEEDFTWSFNEKNRLKMKLFNHINRLSDYYEKNNQLEETVSLYLKLQNIAPYYEESYFELMKLFAQYGERYAVDEQFEMLRAMMREEYGAKPSEKVLTWYETYDNKK